MSQANDRLERARAAADTVEGWLTAAEGELLFRLAASCPSGGTIVEIGSWKGKSTTWLAGGAGPASGIRIFAIDPHEPYLADPQADSLRDFRANLERLGLAALVTPIVARSQAAALSFDRPIDVLFIDGDHEEAPFMADVALWIPKVRAGGSVALHDVRNREWPGVSRALSRLLWTSVTLTDIRFADSIAAMNIVARNTLRDRLRNRWLAVCLRGYGHMPALPGPLAALGRKLLFRAPE
jgi:predicted O-methyltransferase YrrM